jgi:hypothetical protein
MSLKERLGKIMKQLQRCFSLLVFLISLSSFCAHRDALTMAAWSEEELRNIIASENFNNVIQAKVKELGDAIKASMMDELHLYADDPKHLSSLVIAYGSLLYFPLHYAHTEQTRMAIEKSFSIPLWEQAGDVVTNSIGRASRLEIKEALESIEPALKIFIKDLEFEEITSKLAQIFTWTYMAQRGYCEYFHGAYLIAYNTFNNSDFIMSYEDFVHIIKKTWQAEEVAHQPIIMLLRTILSL